MPDNPFAVLTTVVAPAILTNASSVLCLGTGNRIARVVDRTRAIMAEMPGIEVGTVEYQSRMQQLARLGERSTLLLRALRIFYATLGAFAAAALIAVIGSAFSLYDWPLLFYGTAGLGLLIGAGAVTGLVSGCVLMVQETRIAVAFIAEEAAVARSRYDTGIPPGASE
jgi:hypothetical protein